MQKFLREKIQAEHVSALAWLVQTVESTLDTGGAKSKVVSSLGSDLSTFAAELMGMSHELIMSGTLSHEMFHGVLLRELGLNAHCWPLQVGACVALACSIWTFNSVILTHLPLTTYHGHLPLTTYILTTYYLPLTHLPLTTYGIYHLPHFIYHLPHLPLTTCHAYPTYHLPCLPLTTCHAYHLPLTIHTSYHLLQLHIPHLPLVPLTTLFSSLPSSSPPPIHTPLLLSRP